MEIDTGIPPAQRTAIALGLSRLLADSYMVYLKTHSFHWNVEGPMFQTLHQMFMEQYTETWNAIDLIAERIRSLGEYAPGTYKEYARLARVKETDAVPRAEEMVRLWKSQKRRKLPFRYGYPDVNHQVHLLITEPAEAGK